MVSIIVPNYNHEAFLKERLESILFQTYNDFELIILDDASKDGSRRIIENYRENPKVSHIIYNNLNSGSTFSQWEKGIAVARGEFIWLAESDDYSQPSFLKEAVDHLKSQKSALHFCQSRMIDKYGNIVEESLSWPKAIESINWKEPFTMGGKEFILKALRYRNVIPNASAVVFRRELFDLTELKKYKSTGDWLFWIKFLMNNNVSYSPNILNSFRSHENTTRGIKGHRKVLLRYFEEVAIRFKLVNQFHIGDQNELLRFLNATIDVCKLSDTFFFQNFCRQFNLPNRFWLKLVKKKLFY